MRWLVVGANGMLGTDLVGVVSAAGHDVLGVDRDRLDITAPEQARPLFEGVDIVVNCAAWTAVDAAEEQEGSAFAVNATGPGLLARECRLAGARMVQVSTDYVLAGDAQQPYAEDAPMRPVSAYGRTKAAGEWAVRAELPDHLVVRTAWLYGEHGPCFPRTIARVAAERGGLDVVDDQVGQPTWTVDLADLVLRLVEAQVPAGTYHGTSAGSTSWFGFARSVVAAAGMDPEIVRPTTSEGFVRPAPRPAYSVLGHDALRAAGVEPIGEWEGRWALASAAVLGG
ncbi:dTDP-4-dehydrorhamnose reductase [Cellulomonas dongxiuzhuiae]|uniref:dTDP-4-dehydrorhamnose reductase n=1 Tax=Cellulomonas dongxiuzhuiae TaxID=2819979 RepID=A0ABX8GGM6_9CELL|nr:dTDP-4-dehydrorhamnose reductase [Cellulomonas dongxiuzhuiae]MBO3093938.1 dTDP-4-dehydrorhamnose reductase [Cellulomonas dongxiuzhuiae]QWC15020.1 dTDP-4-dehydrorhamnose reductase [Cellulomonas dongxiuzhuiae]